MTKSGLATGSPGTILPNPPVGAMTDGEVAMLRAWAERYAHQAVAAERERCARAIEQYGGAWDATTQNFARLIRGLGA